MKKQSTITYKIIVAGNKGVGKSSILLRYINNQFSNQLYSTIGMDFKLKTIQMNESKIKLQIWDTAGSQTFKSILSAYYQNADAIILVFDNSDINQQSFLQLSTYWIQQIKKFKSPNCQLVLLSSKSDRVIESTSEERIKKFCEQNQINIYRKTSAKNGVGINQAFQQLTHKFIQNGLKQKNVSYFSLETIPPLAYKKKFLCCF